MGESVSKGTEGPEPASPNLALYQLPWDTLDPIQTPPPELPLFSGPLLQPYAGHSQLALPLL